MYRILVTGSSGFIGSCVCERLSELGHKVIPYDTKVDLRQDINREILIFPKLDAIIHCAALTSVTESMEFPKRYFRVNVEGTLNLLLTLPTTRFIYLSTAGVYGEGLNHKEDSPISTPSPYILSKYVGEQLVQMYSKNWIILRLANVVDPTGQRKKGEPNVYQIFEEQEELTIYGDGLQTRDFISVEAVAEAIVTVTFSHRMNEIFNIGSGKTRTILEVARGFNKPYRFASARQGEIKEFGLNVDKAREAGLLR